MEEVYNTDELELKLGESLKSLRLLKNWDRQSLCERAGISMNALRHLESGAGATVKSLIRIVRALDREDWLGAIAPTVSINPLHMGRSKRARLRARSRKNSGSHGENEKS